MKSKRRTYRPSVDREQILDRCLAAFVKAGTLDLSLDDLAKIVGSSKRMLIHYFSGRGAIEKLAMVRLEDQLRAQFQASSFPSGTSLHKVMTLLWERTTRPEARGLLLLVMDLTRRAWSGSKPANEFYREQQRLWVEMLLAFFPEPGAVEAVLQLFQGAMLTYLVTGDREPGRRAIARFFTGREQRLNKRWSAE
jgi:AcrR family transcriptional regulator